MATYQHLPIYRSTYDLLVKVTDATRHYPRDFKRSLGDSIRDEAMLIVLLIYRANSSRGASRSACCDEIVERLQVVELMLRLSKDMGFLSVKRFSSIVQLTDEIGRQAVAPLVLHTICLFQDGTTCRELTAILAYCVIVTATGNAKSWPTRPVFTATASTLN